MTILVRWQLKQTFEQKVMSNLTAKGVEFEFEPHSLTYSVTRDYIPDLLIGEMYIEIKGYFRQDAQRKMRAVKKQHPEKDIRFLFQRADATIQGAKKRKDGTKMTCREWAERYGFQYAQGEEIPEQWIN